MNYLFDTPQKVLRRGKQHRINTDRFFHIMNEGWFVYMRQEKRTEKNRLYKDGVAGPFDSKSIATAYLHQVVHTGGSSEKPGAREQSDSSAEDWRY